MATSTSAVFAVLGLSACVTGGVAYVVVDYTMSPMATDGAGPSVATAAPRLQTAPALPQLSAPASPGLAAPSAPEAVAPSAPIELASLPSASLPSEGPLGTARVDQELGGQDLGPVVVIAGTPPVLPEPRPRRVSQVATLATAPVMRPSRDGTNDAAPSDMSASIETVLRTALTDRRGPAAAASTFATTEEPTDVPAQVETVALQPQTVQPQTTPTFDGALVATSPRPEARPERLAAAFRARQPLTSEEPTGIQVARASTTEASVTPAALQPAPELFTAPRAGNPCNNRLTRAIPRRPRSAPEGSAFMASLANQAGANRDTRIIEAAFGGNVPDFLRNLRPVSFAGSDASGREVVVTICVMPDYLALGSDRDFVRVPLGLPAALRLAEGFDMMLPTTRMVDAIYAQADLRLSPQPMTPGSEMSSTNYFLRHDAMVDDQYARVGGRLGALVAGHKKDVVLANRLSSNPGRVAIYGWHRSRFAPIQPLSTVHGAQYADYSHGIRLVSRTAFVNGDAVDLGTLLTDPRYAGLINSDGVIAGRAVQMAALR
ncbi:MAG: hypothetical protein AAFY68_05835 [Pseudomonadota bacterium]